MFIFNLNSILAQSIILHFNNNQEIKYDTIESTLLKNSYNNQTLFNYLNIAIQFKKDRLSDIYQNELTNHDDMDDSPNLMVTNFFNSKKNRPELKDFQEKIKIFLNIDQSTYIKIQLLNYDLSNVYFTACDIFQIINSQVFSIFDHSLLIINRIFSTIFVEKTVTFDIIFCEFLKSLKEDNNIKEYQMEINQILHDPNSEKLKEFKEKLWMKSHENTINDCMIDAFVGFESAFANLKKLFKHYFCVYFNIDNSLSSIYCQENKTNPQYLLTIQDWNLDNSGLIGFFDKPFLMAIDLNNSNKDFFLQLVNKVNHHNVLIDITPFILNTAKYNHDVAWNRLLIFHQIFYQINKNSQQIEILMNKKIFIVTKNPGSNSLCFTQNEPKTLCLFDNFFHVCMGFRNFCFKYNSTFNINEILNEYQRNCFKYETEEITQIFLSLSENNNISLFDSVIIISNTKTIFFSAHESSSNENEQKIHIQHIKIDGQKERWISGYCETQKFICSSMIQFNAIITTKFISFEMYLPSSNSVNKHNQREFQIDEINGEINLGFCQIENFNIANGNFKILFFNFILITSLDSISSIEYNFEGFIQISACNICFYNVIPFSGYNLKFSHCEIYAKPSFEKNATAIQSLKNTICFNYCSFADNFKLFGNYSELFFYSCKNICVVNESFDKISIYGITKMTRSENSMCLFFTPNMNTILKYNAITKQFQSQLLSIEQASLAF